MKIQLILFFVLIAPFAKAQVLIVDTIKVNTIISEINYDKLGNRESGPYIHVMMNIVNNTDSIIVLQPSKSSFFLEFSYKGKSYFKEAVTLFTLLTFYEKKEIFIRKGEVYKLEFGASLFTETDILIKERLKVYDYSHEILQALPTLKIIYKDPNLNLFSCGISNVEIGKDYYYTPE